MEETQYNPHMADCFGTKIPTLGKWNKLMKWQVFYSKDNVHIEINSGAKIDISGESVCIENVQYDIEDDSYKCYTDKIISRKDGNMTRQQAEQKAEELRNRGFFKKLFGR
ncbi:hypothetical protein JOC34_000552 [Virgibacillus halotolerans]|nr:hypothetical protein [Virgibacillus halotolerans]